MTASLFTWSDSLGGIFSKFDFRGKKQLTQYLGNDVVVTTGCV